MPALLLFVVFLVLKLTGVIAWSWLWVTAPLWGGALLVVVTLIVGMVITALLGGHAVRRF